MRLRILELPKRSLGQATEVPYALIFDRCNDSQLGTLGYSVEVGSLDHNAMKAATGAEFVIVFTDEVDLD